MKEVVLRKDVDINETWDLSSLFKDDKDYSESLARLVKSVKEFKNRYEGKIEGSKDINKALDAYRPILELFGQLGSYASLSVEVDLTNMANKERLMSFAKVQAELMADLSFLESEILQLDMAIIEEALEESEENRVYLEELKRQKPHQLSKEEEKILSSLSAILDKPYELYGDIKFGDTKFEKFQVAGKEYEMNYNTFEGVYESYSDVDVRRKAFEVFSKGIRDHQVATAANYNTHIQTEKILSSLRGYDSVFDYLLARQNISRDLYDRQIDVIMEELAPHMRKYAKLLQEIHGLDKMTYADLKIDVDPEYEPEVSFDMAKNYVLDGLSVLGDEYNQILQDAFNNRWIDYARNQGKRTGAFCSSPYGVNSFVLMFFNGGMDQVMTLAHELGHAGHFQLAGKNQNIYNTRTSMYFVEAPSTTNEIILENYLLAKADDDRMKRWVLTQMVAKTYYHNFVTHFLEAAFQREVYRLADKGQDVHHEILNDIYRKVLKDFWGDAVEITDGAELTWMRQPHYYMGLYPYTYSAGLTIGTQMANKIISQGDEVAKNWVEVLKLGGSLDSYNLALKAGVDISTDQPLKDTIAYIGSLIDEIEEITKKIG